MGDSVGAQSTREKRRMRKRFALLSTLVVLAAALALPASTLAASGYTSKTVYNYCNGYQVNLKMKAIAAGWTNANKLSIDSWAQRKNGGWQTVYQWNRVNYSFAITGAKHTLTAWRKLQRQLAVLLPPPVHAQGLAQQPASRVLVVL